MAFWVALDNGATCRTRFQASLLVSFLNGQSFQLLARLNKEQPLPKSPLQSVQGLWFLAGLARHLSSAMRANPVCHDLLMIGSLGQVARVGGLDFFRV